MGVGVDEPRSGQETLGRNHLDILGHLRRSGGLQRGNPSVLDVDIVAAEDSAAIRLALEDISALDQKLLHSADSTF